MEEPEEKLDEEILNGVALSPRVNSETDTEKRPTFTWIWGIFLKQTKKKNQVNLIMNCNKNKPQRPRKVQAYMCMCTDVCMAFVLAVAISQLHNLSQYHKQGLKSDQTQVRKWR